MATTKTKGTNSKIKELKADKPVQVTGAELKSIQSIVDRINNAQMNIGQLEARKHQVLHMLAGTNDELALIQEKLQKEYGTNDVNIKDGTINYPANVEADS